MRAIAVAAGLAVAGLLAACSTNTPAPQQPSTSTSSAEHGGLAHCLSEHGVPAAPGPIAGPPPGIDQDTWNRAKQACASLEPGPAG